MAMTWAWARLSMMLSPAYAIVTMLSWACISLEGLDDKKADGASDSKGCSFNLSWCITRIWSITWRNFWWTFRKPYFDKEVFREKLGTQKLKVAKLEEQNLKISEIRQELKDSRTLVHDKDVETQKFGMQLQNIQGWHERLWDDRDELAKKRISEGQARSEEAIGDMNKTWRVWRRFIDL